MLVCHRLCAVHLRGINEYGPEQQGLASPVGVRLGGFMHRCGPPWRLDLPWMPNHGRAAPSLALREREGSDSGGLPQLGRFQAWPTRIHHVATTLSRGARSPAWDLRNAPPARPSGTTRKTTRWAADMQRGKLGRSEGGKRTSHKGQRNARGKCSARNTTREGLGVPGGGGARAGEQAGEGGGGGQGRNGADRGMGDDNATGDGGGGAAGGEVVVVVGGRVARWWWGGGWVGA